MSDNELGAYLRARREAVSPAEVGLPAGGRRRTPGLRRAELATLAGISVEYLIRLEQGRDRNPSAQVLAALAGALRLTPADRQLLLLAAKTTSGGFCPGAQAPSTSVRATVRLLLDRLEPAPVVLVNRLTDVLAHTSGYARLAGPIGVLDAERPNLAWFLLTDPRGRAAYPHWDRVADDLVADLKYGSRPADPHAAEFFDALTITAGAAFTERWQAASRPPRRTGVQRLVHPEVGELRLAYETLELSDDAQLLVTYLPADDATSGSLDRLTGRRPGALQAVGSRRRSA